MALRARCAEGVAAHNPGVHPDELAASSCAPDGGAMIRSLPDPAPTIDLHSIPAGPAEATNSRAKHQQWKSGTAHARVAFRWVDSISTRWWHGRGRKLLAVTALRPVEEKTRLQAAFSGMALGGASFGRLGHSRRSRALSLRSHLSALTDSAPSRRLAECCSSVRRCARIGARWPSRVAPRDLAEEMASVDRRHVRPA